MQAAHRQMELSGRELEEYKMKRMVARNELIGTAQVSESSTTKWDMTLQFDVTTIVWHRRDLLETSVIALRINVFFPILTINLNLPIDQALDRMHKESADMKVFIQYSLAPLVFEQVL